MHLRDKTIAILGRAHSKHNKKNAYNSMRKPWFGQDGKTKKNLNKENVCVGNDYLWSKTLPFMVKNEKFRHFCKIANNR